MVKNIVVIVKQNPGKRIVVLTGFSHRYFQNAWTVSDLLVLETGLRIAPEPYDTILVF